MAFGLFKNHKMSPKIDHFVKYNKRPLLCFGNEFIREKTDPVIPIEKSDSGVQNSFNFHKVTIKYLNHVVKN